MFNERDKKKRFPCHKTSPLLPLHSVVLETPKVLRQLTRPTGNSPTWTPQALFQVAASPAIRCNV